MTGVKRSPAKPPAGARALSAQALAAAVQMEVELGELVLRIAPMPCPKDVAVSDEELWIWHGGLGPSGERPEPQRWRLRGVRADILGALRCAEFRQSRRELTVRLSLGPILGGAVELVPTATQ